MIDSRVTRDPAFRRLHHRMKPGCPTIQALAAAAIAAAVLVGCSHRFEAAVADGGRPEPDGRAQVPTPEDGDSMLPGSAGQPGASLPDGGRPALDVSAGGEAPLADAAEPAGQGARLQLMPDGHEFGAVIRGSWDWPAKTFEIKNIGAAPTRPLLISPAGPDGFDVPGAGRWTATATGGCSRPSRAAFSRWSLSRQPERPHWSQEKRLLHQRRRRPGSAGHAVRVGALGAPAGRAGAHHQTDAGRFREARSRAVPASDGASWR